ncbi:MAG: zinc-dependent peptidase [Bacteroidetes bacterium]|nr:zinc-dependent peptidase [Bacteroidota bacterium]
MIFFILFLIALPFLFLYGAYLIYGKNALPAFYYNKVVYHNPISKTEYDKIDSLLSEQLHFFKQLSPEGKAKFIHRLLAFKNQKKFIGKEGCTVTEEMKIVISGAAIQLTFGLDQYLMDNIRGFIIYPSIFFNKMINQRLKGGTPPEGNMQLSWQHVEHGFVYPSDRYNLALHEFAHALKLTITHANDFDFKFYEYLEKWETIGSKEFELMQHGDENFLRKYAAVNMHEFFAVCVEHFFEVPEQFHYNLPNIYYHLCILLNLDPLNKGKDYIVEK